MLRLSYDLQDKLCDLSRAARRNRCAVIRALIAGASVEDLPKAWTDPKAAEVLMEAERWTG